MALDLSKYVQVHERLAEFWKEHPRGRIETEITYPDENTVRCRAMVYRENTVDLGTPDRNVLDVYGVAPAATGHAEEKRSEGFVNATSAVENCETSAVGRALAMMGFSIHRGIASREEVEIAQRKAQGLDSAAQPRNGAKNGSQRPLLVDHLRGAIRGYDSNELADDDEWARLVASATDNQSKKTLVDGLEAKLQELGGNPEAVVEAWQRACEKIGQKS